MSEVIFADSPESVATSTAESVTTEKPPVSARKIVANRLNAQKSTGPRTNLGKTRSRKNATTHGLLAREIVLACPDGPGGSKEFIQLLAQLRDELEPAGVLQNWQVQKLATSLWMQSLVLRSQMARFQRQNALSKLRLAGRFVLIDLDVASQWEEMRSARDRKRLAGSDPGELTDSEMECIRNLHENAAGVERVKSFLTETIHECETSGLVTKKQQDLLREYLGREADTMLLLLSAPSRDESEPLREFLTRLRLKQAIFSCKALVLRGKENPDLDESIPADEKAELLLRYYAFYSREAEHAIAELERLQSRQSGLLLPPHREGKVTAGNGRLRESS